LATHYVNHKTQQKDTHWTETLEAQGRGIDQEQHGKEEQKRKYRRLEKRLERGKKTSLRWNQMEELHEGRMFHIGGGGEQLQKNNNYLTFLLLAWTNSV
jgi:hypothetical protein